jgi:hypothetical protein
LFEQASLSTWLPSSQASPGPMAPSPHFCSVQSDLQVLVSPLSAPASHSSMPASMPSPHTGIAATTQVPASHARPSLQVLLP